MGVLQLYLLGCFSTLVVGFVCNLINTKYFNKLNNIDLGSALILAVFSWLGATIVSFIFMTVFWNSINLLNLSDTKLGSWFERGKRK